RVAPGISNGGGTLALHLAGNIQFFVGTVLGGTGYVRDRAAEFGRRDVPRTELLREIDAALAAVERGVARLPDAALSQPYPQPPGGFAVTTGDFLLHLITHFTYHLGQVDYHRRLLTGEPGQLRRQRDGLAERPLGLGIRSLLREHQSQNPIRVFRRGIHGDGTAQVVHRGLVPARVIVEPAQPAADRKRRGIELERRVGLDQ